jgi:inorganic phosphate transporter, PiT family
MIYIIFLSVIFLAFSNGANDNFKGVATLYGSNTITYKKAIIWATITVGLGALSSIFFAKGILKNFSGKDLIPDELLLKPEFAISVALAVALTVFIATKIGMPISTTHALVGSLCGVGILQLGSKFNFTKITDSFLLPLLLSPFLAAALSMILYYIVSKNKFIQQKSRSLDNLHFFTAGTVGFARGLNDTPKIAGILLIVNAVNANWFLILVTVFMLIGGWLNSKKIAKTMSEKITTMTPGEGFIANFTTSVLVLIASKFSLPVSTTHVSVGSIFGIGTINGNANKKMILKISASWVLTLPLATILSASIYFLLKQI